MSPREPGCDDFSTIAPEQTGLHNAIRKGVSIDLISLIANYCLPFRAGKLIKRRDCMIEPARSPLNEKFSAGTARLFLVPDSDCLCIVA